MKWNCLNWTEYLRIPGNSIFCWRICHLLFIFLTGFSFHNLFNLYNICVNALFWQFCLLLLVWIWELLHVYHLALLLSSELIEKCLGRLVMTVPSSLYSVFFCTKVALLALILVLSSTPGAESKILLALTKRVTLQVRVSKLKHHKEKLLGKYNHRVRAFILKGKAEGEGKRMSNWWGCLVDFMVVWAFAQPVPIDAELVALWRPR